MTKAKHSKLSASLEDYLETIYRIIMEKNAVRAKEIAKQLKVKGSSVTSALRILAERGLINYEPYGTITLTPAGNKEAKQVLKKHTVLEYFLSNVLGVDKNNAGDSACKLEHTVSQDVLNRMAAFIQFTWVSDKKTQKVLSGFKTYVSTNSEYIKTDVFWSEVMDGMEAQDVHPVN
ncbi:MAG: metal-dependent transcriptional regulator [Spirochaetia bacterium]